MCYSIIPYVSIVKCENRTINVNIYCLDVKTEQ